MNNPITGITYLTEGFKLITKPGLKRYVIIPLLLNILVFIGLFMLARHFFMEFGDWVIQFLPQWLRWLETILWIVFMIGFFLVMIYTFVTITNIVASPFNSILAEKVEHYLTGTIRKTTVWDTLKDVPRIVGRQFAILGYYLPRALLLLFLFIVPVVQIFAGVLWFLFSAWFMTLQYMDYPTDNNRIALKTVRETLEQQRGLALGFGTGVLVCSLIPIVNLVIVPAAVAGATKLWVDKWRMQTNH